ncbi:MAG TPA: beta-galactosidase, partial [Streptosporangiaceae bacterium]|nr:beta-galactosidase [Streptosporangiaceae bacterium]
MIWYGGDYNPEQWDPAVWAEDGALMREARVNTATVGVFAWSRLEPEEGRYEFGWLDETLDRLHAAGVRAVLATPTASPPPWFTLSHPDAMPVTRDGTRLWHGSRDTYCAAAPAYRQAAARIAEALAARYAGHPALAMWHVHNEYGTVCWCDHAAAAFRRWLRHRYAGQDDDGLAALNTAWGTDFWSQRYSSWDQVFPPRATQYLRNPSQVLDYSRFWSDELLAAFTEQRDLLRRHTPAIPVTTNFMLPDYQVLDLWAWSRAVDVVAVDHYLDSPGPDGHADIAFAADRARSLGGGRPWMLMEQAASLVYTGGLMKHRPPGRMLRDSVGYLARGADSVLFFQWRASRAGAEMYHSALVPHAGRRSRIFAEATVLGEALGRLAEVSGSVVSAEVAVLWDADSWWALDSAGSRVLPSANLRYLDALRADHAALWRAGIVSDFAQPETDLSRYRLVLAPASYLVSEAAAGSLREYVRAGGHLVVSFFSGIVDACHHVRLGGYPGGLRDILGVTVTEFHPLAPGETIILRGES